MKEIVSREPTSQAPASEAPVAPERLVIKGANEASWADLQAPAVMVPAPSRPTR